VLVSVVIPTLNRPKLLLRAIDSVLRQTHREIEVIVVVDRPDPETVAAIASVGDPRLQVFVNPHPLTAAAARNAGADRATGEWIAFLDDDDEWLPNKLESQLAFAPSTGELSQSNCDADRDLYQSRGDLRQFPPDR
jgi:glycosyltransferase involved in cell wall biosynthesis